MLRWTMAILLSLFALGAAACGGDESGGNSPSTSVAIASDEFSDVTGESEVDVSVVDNEFVDPYITVSPGTKVTWIHEGRNPHNILSLIKNTFRADVDDFGVGDTYTYEFDKPGDYPYYCSVHGTAKLNGQAGVVRVAAASGK
ncbi:MAG: hypothetical protein IT195_04240 [Microthrixaceae bacterium]|nr:hypothetical protein [Microthrixaceae bacterium]